MAKSKAKKQREHMERNGRRNPELNRGDSSPMSLHTRTTPTRQERLDKSRNKHKNRQLYAS